MEELKGELDSYNSKTNDILSKAKTLLDQNKKFKKTIKKQQFKVAQISKADTYLTGLQLEEEEDEDESDEARIMRKEYKSIMQK